MAFKVGDVVVLKSGGPEMTVEDPQNFRGQVECQWFGGRKLESGSFPPASLKYPPADSEKQKR